MPAHAYTLRARLGLAIAAVLCLWGAIESFGFESLYQRQQSSRSLDIGSHIDRYSGVRAATEPTAEIGYMTDLDPQSPAASAFFNIAQYALAPRLLRQGTAPTLVLGNFTRVADYAAIGAQSGLKIKQDFGAGVVLFQK